MNKVYINKSFIDYQATVKSFSNDTMYQVVRGKSQFTNNEILNNDPIDWSCTCQHWIFHCKHTDNPLDKYCKHIHFVGLQTKLVTLIEDISDFNEYNVFYKKIHGEFIPFIRYELGSLSFDDELIEVTPYFEIKNILNIGGKDIILFQSDTLLISINGFSNGFSLASNYILNDIENKLLLSNILAASISKYNEKTQFVKQIFEQPEELKQPDNISKFIDETIDAGLKVKPTFMKRGLNQND